MKYHGIKNDESLNWKQHILDIAIMINRENYIFSKLRDLIVRKTLRLIYHAIFECHLCYFSLKEVFQLNNFFVLQKKSLWTKYFRNRNGSTSPLFRESSILKLSDKTALDDRLFITNFYSQSLKCGLFVHLIFIRTVHVSRI